MLVSATTFLPLLWKGFSIMQTMHKQIGILRGSGLLSLVAGRASAQNLNSFNSTSGVSSSFNGTPAQVLPLRDIRSPASRP